MNISIKPGKYVVAVSGGVDSMVLLNLLSKKPGLELIAAHFDHGIRKDSTQDALLAKGAASRLNLPLELGQTKLGPAASEADARSARYKFLEKVRAKHGADAIVTAHHQDDLLETAIINLVRGTGWRGLVAIQNNPKIIRPLLGYSKKQVVAYAKRVGLSWSDDPTNQNQAYLRNLIRLQVVPKLSPSQKTKLLDQINKLDTRAKAISAITGNLERVVIKNNEIDRSSFALLPKAVSEELLLAWLKQNSSVELDRPAIGRLSVAIKSAKNGSLHEVGRSKRLEVTKEKVRLL